MTRWAAAAVALGVVLSAGRAEGQTAARSSSGPQTDRRWEVEGAVGVAAGSLTSGSTALPAPGAPVPTSSPLFPTRQTSSWLFGDGAALLNGVNSAFGLTPKVQPLDSALTSLGLDTTGPVVAFRVRRVITSHVAAEFSVDVLGGSAHLSNSLVTAVSATSDSAKAALSALLATGPFTNVVVDASSTTSHGTNREIATTGAIVWRFWPNRGWSPYATFGAGVLSGSGDLPSATVQDSYHASILGSVPIAESDHVTLRYDRQSAFVAVLGGGLRREMSARWGWRGDARVFIGGHSPRLLLDATPSVTTGTPAGFIESFTNPAIQFSNNASTGRQSTLSGAPIQGFEAVGAGTETRVVVSAGIFVRF